MTRYERKLFFERLLTLRETYREEAHTATELTIEGIAAFAETTYNDAVAAEAATPTVQSAPKGD